MDFKDKEIPGPSRQADHSGQSKVDLLEIVKILITHPELIRNWRRFYHSLPPPSPDFDQWDRSYNNNTKGIKEIFTEILSHWVMIHGTEAKMKRLYAALISEEFVSVADALNDRFALSCTIVQTAATAGSNQSGTTNWEVDTPISFDLCEPTENFVGRTKEMEMLNTFYQQRKKLIVISGLGGVGKSELVRRFGIKFLSEVQGSCVWIHGDNEESFKESIKRLADSVHIQFEMDKNAVDIFVQVYNRKLKQRPILIIVDNVDKSNSLVEKLIKNCKRLLGNVPLILVTTRNKLALNDAGENIELEMLEPDEAANMVRNGLGSWVSVSDAIKLCDTLGNFPLVVQQSISFIKHRRSHSLMRNFGVPEYLELFDKEKAKLLDYPLNVDDNYDSTTYTTWRVILDDLKRMNGNSGPLALDILRMLPYFDASGVQLFRLVEFYLDDNLSHKSDMDSGQSKLDSGEIEKAVELIQTYSMCRVSRIAGDRTGLKEYLNISSHRLIREFMRLTSDSKMDKEIIRRLFFVDGTWYLDRHNVNKLGQSYKAVVAEMFAKFWKLDVDEEICHKDSEIWRNFYGALETDGLNIQFALMSKRRRYGLDHLLTTSISRGVWQRICKEAGLIPIDILIRFLVDILDDDDGLTSRGLELTCWCGPIINGKLTIEITELVIELEESVTNWGSFSEYYYDRFFTFSVLTTISHFYKLNGDTDRFNQIQSEMLCLMEHPSELTAVWRFINSRLVYSSLPFHAFILNNSNGIVDVWKFKKLLKDSRDFKEVTDLLVNLVHDPKGICHLDLFAILTIAMNRLQDNEHCDLLSNASSRLKSSLSNKDLIIRVIKTIQAFNLGEVNEDELLSLCAEIMETVRKGSVNSIEGIWTLGELCKVLSRNLSKIHIELFDFVEGLVNTEEEKGLYKTILSAIIDDLVDDQDVKYGKERITLFLRLQKYGLHLSILKEILESASVEQIVTIGSNVIENYREGFINKSDTFLAIKYIVKSFINKEEKEKALGILCKALNVENCSSSETNAKHSLFEKVRMEIFTLDAIDIAIATLFYLEECKNSSDPSEFQHSSILLQQILGILAHEQKPTKLLALCFEVYYFRGGWVKLYLCCVFIQILKRLVEMNSNRMAERFLKRIIKEAKDIEETIWYYKACWYLVFGTYYEAQSDGISTSEILEVDDCVNELEIFQTLINV